MTWHRELGQLQSRALDLWMLRDPRNIILEIGPHCLAPLLDLLGPLKGRRAQCRQRDCVTQRAEFLPALDDRRRGRRCDRRAESVFQAGLHGAAHSHPGKHGRRHRRLRCDTYLLHQHTPHELDLDRFHMTRHEAKSLAAQARRGVSRYVLSAEVRAKAVRTVRASRCAARAFHLASEGEVDRRISPELGRDVMSLCCEIGRLGAGQTAERQRAAESRTAIDLLSCTAEPPEILVLGATGFIGQALARQLVEEGRRMRILVRNPSKVPADLVREGVEIVRGI